MTALLIMTALILLNGIFVAAEFAIVGAPRAAIERRAATGNRLARAVQRVLEDPQQQDRYIATAQLGITVASLGLGMYGEHVLADRLYRPARRAAASPSGSSRTASRASSRSPSSPTSTSSSARWFRSRWRSSMPSGWCCGSRRRCCGCGTPSIRSWSALNGIGNLVLKMFGVNRQGHNPDQYYTPEELQFIVQESEELGALRVESGQMLQELFEFGDLTAGEVMVPRVRVTGIPLGTTPAQVRESLGRSPHTRYPVYERRSRSHPRHGAHQGSAGCAAAQRGDRAHARPAAAAGSRDRGTRSVLATMRRERTQMVVVLDEHGGTAGVVTLEDLFEEVVGEIEEGPANASAVYRDAEGRLHVPGTMRIDELGQEFELELEHEDVDSVSGLVLTLLGRPPASAIPSATTA